MHHLVTGRTPQPARYPLQRERDEDGSWKTRLNREISQLKPWYELSCRRRGGRTLVGVADQSPEHNIQILAEHLDDGVLPTDISWLKRAVEDIKAYYTEAMTAQPGDYDRAPLQAQFWHETSFGAAVLAFYHQFQNSDDDQLKLVARILAPREALVRPPAPGEEKQND